LKLIVKHGGHVYFEWATSCHGWNLPELTEFRDYCSSQKQPLQKVIINGCAFWDAALARLQEVSLQDIDDLNHGQELFLSGRGKLLHTSWEAWVWNTMR
jgi:hypothetical protein